MEKQALERVVEEFLESARGKALVAKSLSASLSNDGPVLNSEEPLGESDIQLVLTRGKLKAFNLAYRLALRNGGYVSDHLDGISRALGMLSEDPT